MTNPTAHGVSVFDGLVDAPSDLPAAIARVRAWLNGGPNHAGMNDLRTIVAAAERAAAQPIRWMVVRDSHDPDEYFETESEARANACLGLADARVRPLYAAPPAQAEPQEGDLLHTMMEWARTEEGRKQLADAYRPRLWACAKRVADPQNEAATCRHWCGDIEHCQPIASAPAQAEPQPAPDVEQEPETISEMLARHDSESREAILRVHERMSAPSAQPDYAALMAALCPRNQVDGKHDWETRTPKHVQCRWCHEIVPVTPAQAEPQHVSVSYELPAHAEPQPAPTPNPGPIGSSLGVAAPDVAALVERLCAWQAKITELRTALAGATAIANSAGATIRTLTEERDRPREALRRALTELVACKDIKDQADYNLLYAQTTGSIEEGKRLTEEYRRRKVDAWRDARAALAAKGSSDK